MKIARVILSVLAILIMASLFVRGHDSIGDSLFGIMVGLFTGIAMSTARWQTAVIVQLVVTAMTCLFILWMTNNQQESLLSIIPTTVFFYLAQCIERGSRKHVVKGL